MGHTYPNEKIFVYQLYLNSSHKNTTTCVWIGLRIILRLIVWRMYESHSPWKQTTKEACYRRWTEKNLCGKRGEMDSKGLKSVAEVGKVGVPHFWLETIKHFKFIYLMQSNNNFANTFGLFLHFAFSESENVKTTILLSTPLFNFGKEVTFLEDLPRCCLKFGCFMTVLPFVDVLTQLRLGIAWTNRWEGSPFFYIIYISR